MSGSEAARRAARIRLLLALLLTGLVVIAGRLSYLQLLHAPDYLALGRANAVQTEHLSPFRGRIRARDGTVLAGNRVAVDLLYRGAASRAGRACATCWGSPVRRAPPTLRTPRRRGAVLAWNIPDETVSAVAELIAGQDVVLTLDVRAQRAAERVLAGALKYVNAERARRGLPQERVLRGALVAMNPRTGEIVALASAPGFDPNVVARRPVAASKVAALLGDRAATPLANRAVSAYPPASTFKVVSSLALLDGVITPGT